MLGSWWAYLVKRLLLVLLTLLALSVVVFLMVQLVPGDPAVAVLGPRATEERLEEVRQALGLHLPLHQQYLTWLTRLLQGDLGRSIHSNRPVAAELSSRLPATLELTLASFIGSVVMGIPLGVAAVARRNTWLDRLSVSIAVLGQSVPVFVVGLALLYWFSFKLDWLPLSGRLSVGTSLQEITGLYVLDSLLTWNVSALGDVLAHLVLPTLTLTALNMGLLTRMTRSAMLEVLDLDFVRVARAKGLSERVVLFRHVLRNALIPVLTVVGLQVGGLLGGAVLTETVFSWPGLGTLMVDAVFRRDYPMLQGSVLTVGLLFMLTNLLVDLAYVAVDPRVTYE